MTRPIGTLLCMLTGVLAMTPGDAIAQDAPKARTDSNGDPLPNGALARLGTLRWSHPKPVVLVAFLPDGKTVLTGCEDRVFRIWDRATGKEIRRIVVPPTPSTVKAQRMPPFAVVGALSVDGKTLATAADQQICFWDVATGKKTHQFAAPKIDMLVHDTVKALVFAPDDKTLAVRTIDEAVHVIAADTGQPVGQFQDQPKKRGGISGATHGPTMAFSPDGKRIASAHEEGPGPAKSTVFLRVNEIESGKALWRVDMDRHRGFVLGYAPNGKLIAAGTGIDTKFFDADNGKLVRTFEKGKGHGWNRMLFSPDGKYLLGRHYVGEYAVWAVDSGDQVYRFGKPQIFTARGGVGVGWSHGLAVSADGKTLAAGTDNTVRLWDLDAGKEIPPVGGSHGAIIAVAVSRDGRRGISRGIDGMIRMWDLADSRQLRYFEEPKLTRGVAFAPDGQSLACGTFNGEITIADTASGQPHKSLKTGMDTAPLAYSPDSKMVAYLGMRFDGGAAAKILLHDVATGAQRLAIALPVPVPPAKPAFFVTASTPGGPGTGGLSLAFTPDGRTLVGHFPGDEPPRSPKGKVKKNLHTLTTLRFWDVATGSELRTVELPTPLGRGSMVLGTDGRVLVCENRDGTVSVWELASGKERVRLGKAEIATSDPFKNRPLGPMSFGRGMQPRLTASTVALSPDGRLVAFKSPANTARIWDVDTGTELGTFRHDGDITTLAFTPDGRRLITGSTDTTLLVWDVTRLCRPDALPKLDLSATAQRDLWNDLVGDDAGKAFTAIRRLAASPQQAVPLLREKIKPVAPPDPKLVERLIRNLDSSDFEERNGATEALLRLGEVAVPALQKVATGQPTLETRRRVEALLTRLAVVQPHVVRAVEVLERAATPEARQALQALAEGAPAAQVTREAHAALDRLR